MHSHTQGTGQEQRDRPLLTIKEFGLRYNVCRTRVYALLNAGLIDGRKSGRLTVITFQSAEAWASNLPKYEPGATVQAKRG